MTNKFELWVSITTTKKGELRGVLSANRFDFDPDTIEHGRVNPQYDEISVLGTLHSADKRFTELGYALEYGDNWVWSSGHDAFRRMATMGESETQKELVIAGHTYRLVEDE